MYRLTFCDPFVPKLTDLGQFPPEKVVDQFEEIEWSNHLNNLRNAGPWRDYFSPSFSIVHPLLRHELECCVVDNHDDHEWFIFYKRPETVRSWFGLRKQYREAHTSNVCGQKKEDVIRCLQAFVRNDFDFLKEKVREDYGRRSLNILIRPRLFTAPARRMAS